MKLPSSRQKQQIDYFLEVLNKHYWQSRVKEYNTAFAFWLLGGAHFAYLGKWGQQIFFWVLLGIGYLIFIPSILMETDAWAGGLVFLIPAVIWWLVDIFYLPDKLQAYNAPIFRKIREMEAEEKEAEQARNMAMMAAATGRKGKVDGDKNKGEADAEGDKGS